MPSKRSEEKKKAQATTADAPKVSRVGWKTGEQLEWMLTEWASFVHHQNEKTLDRFWPRVYHGWATRWPIIPSPESVAKHGSKENAILVIRMELRTKIRNWFHNHGRPGSKTGKSDLRLTQGDKRKLAPVQFYCSYAWNKGLEKIVLDRWQAQKHSYMSTDDDDPTADTIDTSGSGSHIPINFKIMVAKEQYNLLTPAQKKEIDNRREEDVQKKYRSIPDINDDGERIKKLREHHRNQPSISTSIMRVIKNLEDQTGAIAHVLVGYMDPETGAPSFAGYCQGKTTEGLGFSHFYGDTWEKTVVSPFRDWGMAVFGELGTKRRSSFLLSPGDQGSTPTASSSTNSDAMVIDKPTETPPGFGSVIVDGNGPVGGSSTTPFLHVSGTTQAVPPQTLVPSPAVDQLSAMTLQTPGSNLGFPEPIQLYDFNQPITWDMFPSSQFVGSVNDYPEIVLPTPTESLVVTPSSTRSVTPNNQVVIPPTVWEPPSPSVVTTLVLDATATSAITHEPASLVTSPVLESLPLTSNQNMIPEPAPLVSPLVLGTAAATATANQTVVYPLAHESSSLGVPVLGPSQINQTTGLPMPHRHISPRLPSRTLEFSQPIAPNQIVVAQRPTSHLPATDPHSTALQHYPDRSGLTTKSSYKTRGKAGTTTTTRRDSLDGAPDIILSLGSSGYEVAKPSSQPGLPVTSESDTDSSTQPSTPSTPSSAFSPEIIPSSQQTIEECMVMPAEALIQAKSSASNPVGPSSQRLADDASTTLAVSKTTPAPSSTLREVPTYAMDKSDFPSWFDDREKLDYVLSVEGGELWKRLIAAWIRQERRVGFGLNEKLGASLSSKNKPRILGDYFKWHHNPTKGDSVALPAFGNEVAAWWSSLQPEWRQKDELSPNDQNNYSYILAGGKKGVFLLILCLAWWDKAHGRDVEKEKARRCDAAKAGMGETALNLDNLLTHETKWLEIVNDLLFVMELAQAWPVPGEGTSGALADTPGDTRTKRAAERGSGSTRKKAKRS